MVKKKEYSVIVNINLEFKVKAKSADEAEDLMQEVELPKEYVEDSFEIVKTGLIGKDGGTDYND